MWWTSKRPRTRASRLRLSGETSKSTYASYRPAVFSRTWMALSSSIEFRPPMSFRPQLTRTTSPRCSVATKGSPGSPGSHTATTETTSSHDDGEAIGGSRPFRSPISRRTSTSPSWAVIAWVGHGSFGQSKTTAILIFTEATGTASSGLALSGLLHIRNPTSNKLWRRMLKGTSGSFGRDSATARPTSLPGDLTARSGQPRKGSPLRAPTTGNLPWRRTAEAPSTLPGIPTTRATMTLPCGASARASGAT